ncbi:hypothetical protein HKT18_05955 [Flavobacterium sp. IMCC34852]|uniref:Lipoprotein n=1 Tax=Flavobacterium rivulicola TaxID=2732161 RepID=A0A7Y3R891_9FLAO|nr:hypothetical protein [Flavobacterium sp. IMCC34852]NNT71759.1 hypothetical protein [Flavobacterium sp. IMCC34852]
MRLYSLLCICLLLMLSNCSSSEDGVFVSSEYMPGKKGNYWKYDVFGDQITFQRDSLYIQKNFKSNEKYYSTYDSKGFGFYTSLMNGSNAVYRDQGFTQINGFVDWQICENFIFSANIFLTILNDTAVPGAIIDVEQKTDTRLNSFESGINDVNGDYRLQTELDQVLPTYTTPNGNIYSDVMVVKLTLNLKIYNKYFIDDVPLIDLYMDNQNVIESKLYFAKGIGMVYAHTSKEIHFDSQFGNLPVDYSGIQEEILTNFRVLQ